MTALALALSLAQTPVVHLRAYLARLGEWWEAETEARREWESRLFGPHCDERGRSL